MKFRCERDALLEAVQFASRAISNRATLPVLAGLRIEARESGDVVVAATDLELTMQTAFHAGVDEPGRSIVPGRLFGEMARSLGSGGVSLATGDGEVEIGSGRGQFRVKTLAADDYPALPVDDASVEGERVVVDAGVLGVALSQVIRAASGDESRQILTGVLWEIEAEALTLAATDSYRLAVRTLEINGSVAESKRVVVPARALGELGRALQGTPGDVVATVKDNLVSFAIDPAGEAVGRSLIGSRFIEGEFPNYKQLIPEGYQNNLTVDREALLDVSRRVGLLAQNNLPVKLRLDAELEISAHTPDVGEGQEVLDAEYQGEGLVIAFNPHFLNDGASAIQSQRLVLEAADGLKPAILRGEGDDGFTYLLMPVRLS
jgi:DNA polymerase-3 subunit beta